MKYCYVVSIICFNLIKFLLYQVQVLILAYHPHQPLFFLHEAVSKILTKRKVRESIEEEIASSAGIPAEEIIVDVPTLPSIPYNPNQLNPMEIRIFELVDGKRILHNLSEYSNIAEMMKVYLDVIRVYTSEKYRTEVGRAAREIFRELPDTALIHM